MIYFRTGFFYSTMKKCNLENRVKELVELVIKST
jgi:hypothetical protein